MISSFVKSGSANIYYEIYGEPDRPVVVLLHGNGQSMRVYDDLIGKMQNDYCILAIDSRGHGKSEFGKAQLSIGAMAVDLENVLIELNIKNVSIVGFGDGANIAMLFAIKCSDMVDKLVIIGGNYNFRGYSILSRIFLRVGFICSIVGALFDQRNKLNKEYFSLIVKEPNLKKSSLRAIKAKTLIVSAKGDIITQSHSRSMANVISNSQYLSINADRFWIFKDSDRAYKIIDEFLRT